MLFFKVIYLQFGFQKYGTTEATFIFQQMREIQYTKNKQLFFALVDLKVRFDYVSRTVKWWATKEVGLWEFIFLFVQVIYKNNRNKVRVSDIHANEFAVKS